MTTTPHGQVPQQEAQEPTTVDKKTMELAESVGLIGPASRVGDLHAAIQRFHDLICVNATIKAAVMAAEAIGKQQAAPQQEAQEPTFWTRQLSGQGREFLKQKPFTTDWTPLYTAPQPAPAPSPLSDDTTLLDGLARLNWYVGPGNFYCDEAGGMNDYDDKNSSPEELRQAIRAALAAHGDKLRSINNKKVSRES